MNNSRSLLLGAPGWILVGMFVMLVLLSLMFGGDGDSALLFLLIIGMAIIIGIVLNWVEMLSGFWSDHGIAIKILILCLAYGMTLFLILVVFSWGYSIFLNNVDVEGSMLMTAIPVAIGYCALGSVIAVVFSLLGD